MGRLKEIRNAIAACFQANKEPLTKGQVLAWIGNNFREANFNLNTLQTQLYRCCVNSKAKTTAPKILWYDKRTRKYSLTIGVGAQESDQVDSPEATVIDSDYSELESLEIEDQSDLLVSVEAQLRDYLAKNLGKLEKGLNFWHDSPPSVEYTINGRRIDILAKDLQGNPVIIELKRERAYDRVVGQALLYQALVSAKFGVGKVRVILVANEMTTELRLACTKQLDFTLFEYELTMQLNPVSSSMTEGEY